MTDASTCAHCVRQITATENSWVDDRGETTCPVLGGPHFPAARNIPWPAKIMTSRWTAMPNDLIGGWCVMAGDKPPSAAREPEVADFVTQEAAEHIAVLHNQWLEAEAARTPRDWVAVIDGKEARREADLADLVNWLRDSGLRADYVRQEPRRD